MEEIWKDIMGYEGLYMVSNCGRIKSLVLRSMDRERILSPTVNGSGYKLVGLRKKNKAVTPFIHRLIAIHFIQNPEGKPNINHINGIKTDNRIENLEWCTQSENLKHAHRIGLKSAKGEKNSQSKISAEQAEYEKYKTACEGINPDNPMAVAENLKEMYHLLDVANELSDLWMYSGEIKPEHKGEAIALQSLKTNIQELLTKMQAK